MNLRNPFAGVVAVAAAVLISSAIAIAQNAQPQQPTHESPMWKYDGRNRAVGSGGPAPVHDLSGSWAGPRSGAGVRDSTPGDAPLLTPLGQKLFSANKSMQKYNPAGTTLQERVQIAIVGTEMLRTRGWVR